MTEVIVRTQGELDAALKDPANRAIMIASEDDVTLDVSGTAGKIVGARSGILRVCGAAQVGRVSGDARIWDVSGDARIESVSGDARIGDVSGDARIGDVYGDAQVGDVSGDALIWGVYGDARIESVYGDARIESVSGDAQVGRVYGDARIGDVSGDARIGDVYDRARIRRVFDYAQVSLYGHARVEHPLGAHAVAYLHSPNAWASGAHVIDMTKVDLHDPETWAAHKAADLVDGEVILWKALGESKTSGERFGCPVTWEAGYSVSCDDWDPTPECGGGLHLSPYPREAITYLKDATRMFKCVATLTDIVPIIYNNDSDKCKVKSVRVIEETNIDGTPLLASEEK